jgi:hypothetical protein
MIMIAPSNNEALAYALNLLALNGINSPSLGEIVDSTDNVGALDVHFSTDFNDGLGTYHGTVTVWFEADGALYGEW